MAVFHIPFDILASVIYGTELVMWIGIMICGVVLGRGEKDGPASAAGNSTEQEMELPTIEDSGARATSVVNSRLSGMFSFPLAYVDHDD